MKDFANLIVNPANLIAFGVGLLAFFAFMTLGSSFSQGQQLDSRMKAVANRREELKRASRAAMIKDNSTNTLRQKDGGLQKTIVDRLNLKTLLEDPKVIDKLAMAGFRGPRPITLFYFARLIAPFVFASLAAVYVFVLLHSPMPTQQKFLIVAVGFVLGYYAPNIYISNIAAKRKESILAVFPDALDLLLISVEAGMSVEAALQKVSVEIGSTSIALAEELSLLVAELSYLPERRQAYEGLARRTNHPGIKSVCTAMIQGEKYGTPLGSALRIMAKENRELRMSAAEKKAAALPAQLTVPMIVFFLPVLFVVILGPSIIQISDIQKKNPNAGM